MSPRINREVRLRSRPSGVPQADNFEIVQAAVPDVADGQVRIRNIYLSVEPAMRGWVSAVANYSEPVAIGSVMRSFAVGRIEASRHADFHVGDVVTGLFGWQDYAVMNGAAIQRKVSAVDLPMSTALGVLGLNGLTAYLALLDIGQPRPGETVVVSTAAGSVGSCAGQIAKLKGCRSVGITGGPEKVRLCLEEFGFDAAIDYKAAEAAVHTRANLSSQHDAAGSAGLDSAVAAACPSGVDIYFDNTAGWISDAVMSRLNVGARIIVCGTASVASWDPLPVGPRVERHLLTKRARMQGFLAFDHASRFADALRDLEQWVRDGKIRYREDVLEGIESAPDAIAGLYRGENLGKRLIRLSPEA